jgi:TatD DNase family protein
MLVDIHMHLQMAPLLATADAVLSRARRAGVVAVVVNGTHPGDWAEVSELAGRYPRLTDEHPRVIPCFGVHPWQVGQCREGWDGELAGYLDRHPSAVGEVGLDRWIEPRDEALQERIFVRQLELARERSLPVMVHCLRAWEWLQGVLDQQAPLPRGFLLHAYGGSAELPPHFAARGAYFSFSGSTFEPRRAKLRAALLAVPMDRLLLETDAPDMLPPPEMGPVSLPGPDGRAANEPANLALVARAVAELRGVAEPVLRRQVYVNAQRFLGALL